MFDMPVKYESHDEKTPVSAGNEDMGQRIRRLRLKSNMSQQQLADLLSISKSAVSQWELGKSENVKLPTFLRLCYILGKSPHYLVFGPGHGSTGGLDSPCSMRYRHTTN